MKPDLQTTADVQRVVHAFYTDLMKDPAIGPHFEATDLATHLPRLCAFWSSVAFQRGTYRRPPFVEQVALEKLRTRHFMQWLRQFEAAVDDRYAGERAEHLKTSARHMATISQIALKAHAR